MAFEVVAKVGEILPGKMKHVEVSGIEILVANVEGKYYAVSDRCGHMNGRLSAGTLTGNTVICPVHFSRFDVTTGKVVAGPRLTSAEDLKKFNLAPEMIKVFERLYELQTMVKTYDLPVFNVTIKGQDLLIDI